MALRDKIAQRSQPFLPEGTNVRHVFLTQTGPNPMFFLLTYLIIFWIKYQIVCVSDDAVYVLRGGKFRPAMPKELVATLPRQTQFGPVSGMWAAVTLNGERNWVHKRFHKDIADADAGLASAA